MDLNALRLLHAYDAWANQRVAQALADPATPAKARRTFGHIIAALELWWGRFAGMPLGQWEAFPLISPSETNERLTEAALRQKLSKRKPDSRQGIIEAAVIDWLKRNHPIK